MKGVVMGWPAEMADRFAGEPFLIYVMESPEDWLQDSYSATVGYIEEGTEVEILEGPEDFKFGGEDHLKLLRIRGVGAPDTDHAGQLIEGWTTEHTIIYALSENSYPVNGSRPF